jgi:serine/threonine-protein kinase PpkA
MVVGMQAEPAQATPKPFPTTEAAPLESAFGDSTAYEMDPRAPSSPSATVATFVYARLHNFNTVCQAMSGAGLTTFVNEVRRVLSDAVLKLGGEIAQRRPDSILAVFSNAPDARKPDHAQRGLHAAILTVYESVQLANRVATRPQAAGLPPLTLAVGVHLGAGEITRRVNGAPGMVHAVGEAVEIARLLEVTAADLHWSVAASAPTRLAAGGRVEPGRIGSVGLPDDTFIEFCEVTALVPRKGSTSSPRLYATLRDALAQNQQLSRAAAAAASGRSAIPGHLLIEGYRLLRKLGEGGMATIFLAEPATGGEPQVLKVLRLDSVEQLEGLQRFMQEFALLAQVNHPNVARIHRLDFSVGNAYIAMEYFPQGDLRTLMKKALGPGAALRYIREIAAGLDVIHRIGIVHRDLKPDNLMLRRDGSLAIADFGVAKQVTMLITDTGAGEVVGTPYYLSPEQALGQAVDARCDLYSFGVLAYEMLTGQRPYTAKATTELLNMHVNAPVPLLPAPYQHLQPVLGKLMAKDREDRYASTRELLDELDRLGL